MDKIKIKRAIKNAKYITISNIMITIIQVFIVGYNIKVLGESVAGFYFLIQTITGIGGGVINLGFGAAAIKDISANSESGDKNETKGIVGTLWTFNTLMSFFLVLFIILMRSNIIEWSKIESQNEIHASTSLIFFALSFFLSISFSVFEILPSAYQEYKYQSIYSIVSTSLGTAGNFLILYFIPSILNLALFQFLLSMINVIIIFTFAYRITKLKFKPCFNFEILKRLFPFSSKVFVTNQSYSFRDSIDRWSLNTVQGSYSLPGFIIGQRIFLKIQSFLSSVMHILFPMVSEIYKKDDEEEIFKIYSFAQSIVPIFGTIIFTVILFGSFDLLKLWVSNSFSEKYYFIFQLSMLQGAFSVLLLVPFYISGGMNKPNMNLINAMLQLIIIILSSIFIIPRFGVLGAAIAQLIAYISINFTQNIFMTKYFREKKMKDILQPQISSIFLILIMISGLVLYNILDLENSTLFSRMIMLSIIILMQLITVYVIEFIVLKDYKRINMLKTLIISADIIPGKLKILKVLNR